MKCIIFTAIIATTALLTPAAYAGLGPGLNPLGLDADPLHAVNPPPPPPPTHYTVIIQYQQYHHHRAVH